MDRNRNRDDDLDRENRGNQVPGVRREEQMHGSSGDRSRDSMSGSQSNNESDRSMRGDSSGTSDRSTRDVARPGDELRGGGPDRGGILNDDRDGTNRNQTGSNVNDERSRSTGTPADDRSGGA